MTFPRRFAVAQLLTSLGCSALIVAGCGSSGATGPESSPNHAAFALAQIMEAKALATNPIPPEGTKVATTCSRVKSDEWTCSVAFVGADQRVTAEAGYADNIVVYDGHGTFELKPARAGLSDKELSGAIPLAAFAKMEKADGTSVGEVSFPNVAAESEPQDLEAVASSLTPGSVAGGSTAAGSSETTPSSSTDTSTSESTASPRPESGASSSPSAGTDCGSYDVHGGRPPHYTDITARGVSCATAHVLAKEDALGPSATQAPPSVQGFTCTHPTESGEPEARCTDGPAEVDLYANLE